MGDRLGYRKWQGALLRLAVALCCAWAGICPAIAQEPGVPGYHRVLWRASEGAPIEVRGVVTTADGFLWIGSYTGLYRFDGLRFDRFEAPWGQALPSNAITAMAADPPSGVWVGASGGHIIRIANNRIVERHELPDSAGHILRLVINGAQRYAITSGGLYEEAQGAWKLMPVRPGAEPLRPFDAALQPDGALWLASSEGFFVRSRPGGAFVRVDTPAAGPGKFSRGKDRDLWYCGEGGGLRRFRGAEDSILSNEDFRCYQIYIDGQGMAWVEGTEGSGRVDPYAALEDRTGKVKGALTETAFGESTVARSITQDANGSIWVGTTNGLSQFHPYRLGRPDFPGGLGGLAPSSDGGMWVISFSRGLIKVGAHQGPRPAAGDRLTHVMRDAQGTVWAGGHRRAELVKVVGDTITTIPFAPGGQEVFVVGMARAADGALWVATAPAPHGSLYRLTNGQWVKGAGIPALSQMPVTGLWSDSQGRIWLGFTDSRIGHVDQGRLTFYPQAPSLQLGSIRKFAEYQGAILIGGDDGMALALGDNLSAVRLQPPLRILGPTGILTTREGEVWINQASNLLRIPAGQMQRAIQDPAAVLGAEVFDYRDGRVGAPVVGAPHPTVAEQADGTLWFAAANLTTFNRSAAQEAKSIHRVMLSEVSADSRPLRKSEADGYEVPAEAEQVSLTYTASDLLTPDRLQIRFKLDGVDSEWRIGGKDRAVTYKRPPPGTYLFRVATSNELGLWNEDSVGAQIDVLPLFYETTWFKILLAGFVIGLCGLLIWARSTWLTMRIRDKLRERARERERIARELHDTLLQGIQGLMLHVQTVANDLPEDGQSRKLMNRALDRADALMAEGRQRVSDLRLQEEGAPLGTSLQRYLVESGLHDRTRITVRQAGRPREIQPSARLEILRIGAEAAANSVQHSGCKRVRILVRYDRDALRLRVRDDGCGLDGMLAAKGRPGHFGIRGMYERAVSIRAKFRLSRSKAGGTTMDLIVPAAIAYGDRRSRWLRRILSTRPKPSSAP
jgi:hypothetical protein